MAYTFTTTDSGVVIADTTGPLLIATNSPVKIVVSRDQFTIYQEQGLGQLITFSRAQVQSVNGSPPGSDNADLLAQLMAVFPDALAAAGAVSSVNNIEPDGNHNITLTAADINAVAVSQLSQVGGANKVPQLDNGGDLVLQDANTQAEYGASAIFFSKNGGGWLDIDASGLEIDLFSGGGTTIHMGLDGIDAQDQPITTTHVPANDNDLINKQYLDGQLAAVSSVVASDGRNAQSANINSPTFYAVPTSGMYRASAFVVQSQAATTSSTLPSCSVSYTEVTTGVAVQDMITQTANTNLVGLHVGGSVIMNALQGSNIGYITSDYASSGGTSMQYSIHIKIEFLG